MSFENLDSNEALYSTLTNRVSFADSIFTYGAGASIHAAVKHCIWKRSRSPSSFIGVICPSLKHFIVL